MLVLTSQIARIEVNPGFRIRNDGMYRPTYEQVKTVFSYKFSKRKIDVEGVSTSYPD